MNLTNQEAQKVNTAISNLRKNLSEGEFDLWQEGLRAGFTKVTSRRVKYSGFQVGGVYGSSVEV
jgi:hypothetical protein